MNNEQRRQPRLAISTTVFIELMAPRLSGDSSAKVALCETIDLSSSGMQVTVSSEPPIGAILPIGVQFFDESKIYYLTGEIKWVRPEAETDGKWRVGIQLLNALGSDIALWSKILGEAEFS